MGRNSGIIALGLLLSRCSARGPPLADISYTLPEISWEILKSFVKSGNLLGNPEIFREIWKSKLGLFCCACALTWQLCLRCCWLTFVPRATHAQNGDFQLGNLYGNWLEILKSLVYLENRVRSLAKWRNLISFTKSGNLR